MDILIGILSQYKEQINLISDKWKISNSIPDGSCIEPYINSVSGSLLNDEDLKNCILIDPAGTAFKNNSNTFNGGGFSASIYKTFTDPNSGKKMINQKHKIKNNVKSSDVFFFNEHQPPELSSLLHAIGPDWRKIKGNNLEKKQKYWNDLDKVFTNIRAAIKKNNLIRSKNNFISLPLISANIYGPPEYKTKDGMLEYLQKYILLIEKYLCPFNIKIKLGIFSK